MRGCIMLSNLENKICTKCDIKKLFSEFSFNPKTKDKKNSWCKSCTNLKIKKYKEQNRIKVKNDQKKYFENNKIVIYKYRNRRYKNIFSIKLAYCLKSHIDRVLKNKTHSIINLLGCSIEELKKHLEKQFKPGMNWSNHTLHGWHIDHIRPISSFDLTKKTERELCFHYSNLQPLWAEENLKKSDKYVKF